MSSGIEYDEDRFRRVYLEHFEPLLAYALRRVAHPEDAADVVAETFLVAWRRRHDIPVDDEARLWLYGVARRVLANHRRGGVRRQRLGERLREHIAVAVAADPGSEVPERLTVRAALAGLGELDREVLMLTVWEGLQPREVAAVLGVGPAVVRTRLSRARARLVTPTGSTTVVRRLCRSMAGRVTSSSIPPATSRCCSVPVTGSSSSCRPGVTGPGRSSPGSSPMWSGRMRVRGWVRFRRRSSFPSGR
ncbi:RNA polymerase sigma factor [Micromonospora sp. NPDC049175]|uniref:RNA polymerase sigma factor n=1 Tax=Micromonospora sp. NPDC049175 TaxID=3364266 RepID=UPI00371917C5